MTETNSDVAEVIVAAEQGPVLADDSLYNLGDEGGDSALALMDLPMSFGKKKK